MRRWLTTGESNSCGRFLDRHDPDEDQAAGKDVDERDQVGQEAVLHVARSLKVPLEDCHKDKMHRENNWHLHGRCLEIRQVNLRVVLTAGKKFLSKR